MLDPGADIAAVVGPFGRLHADTDRPNDLAPVSRRDEELCDFKALWERRAQSGVAEQREPVIASGFESKVEDPGALGLRHAAERRIVDQQHLVLTVIDRQPITLRRNVRERLGDGDHGHMNARGKPTPQREKLPPCSRKYLCLGSTTTLFAISNAKVPSAL